MQFIHNSFYKNKKILITGHTGFKGSWLTIWLTQLGADIVGIALEPKTSRDLFVLSGIGNRIKEYRHDIRDLQGIVEIFTLERPEIVFHLAAQPLVLESYKVPVETYETNIMGTVNVLESIRQVESIRSAIMVTSDKCYENKEINRGYIETDPLGGFDPYSSSKGCAEIVINSYRNSFFKGGQKCGIASVRAGNVIGGGDWSENRIIPDCVKAFEKGEKVYIRNPKATRPWQHVLEPIGAYLYLAELLYFNPQKYSEAWNFGPYEENRKNVLELVTDFITNYEGGEIEIDKSSKQCEAGLLSLDISKAINRLNWKPVLNFNKTMAFTAEWYKNYQKISMLDFSINQIKQYENLWK